MHLDGQTIKRIRDASGHMEAERAMTKEALEIIIEKGWFKLYLPKAFGGSGASLPEALRIFEYASRIDGSFGWTVMIGAGGGYFAAYMKPETAQELFGPVEAVVAGSGTPLGTAERTDGGYIVNGSWKYCSGAHHATMFTANCIVKGSEPSEIITIVLMPDQVKIDNDWQAFGLKGTGSHSMHVQDQFVPDERIFNLSEQLSLHEEPVFDYPFLPFAQATFAAVIIGIARHFLEEAAAVAERCKASWDAGTPGRSDAVLRKIEQMEHQLDGAIRTFYETIEQSWTDHVRSRALTDAKLEQVSRVCKQTADIAVACGQQVFRRLGIVALMENEPVNRIWRDLQTASQHSLLLTFE